MGDVRPPLTSFSQLGEEGVGRRDKMVPLMHEIESFAEKRQSKTQSG